MLKKRNNSQKKFFILGICLLIIGMGVICGKYLYTYFLDEQEKNLINIFFDNQENIIVDNNIEQTEEIFEEQDTQSVHENNYVAVIKISKINLVKGLFAKSSYYNNVNYNILVVDGSDMPDVENGNVILAGHSGSGRTAYFKNLYKLSKYDEVSIFYNGIEYKYEIESQYEVNKTGSVLINRDTSKKTITLITCKKDEDKQIIYVGYLVNEVSINA